MWRSEEQEKSMEAEKRKAEAYFDGDQFSRRRVDGIDALESSWITIWVSRRGEDLAVWSCSQRSAARLRFRLPCCPESFLFYGGVGSELDNHKVGGGSEDGWWVEAAGEGGRVDGRRFCPRSSQNLDRVKSFLSLKLWKLRTGGTGREFNDFRKHFEKSGTPNWRRRELTCKTMLCPSGASSVHLQSESDG